MCVDPYVGVEGVDGSQRHWILLEPESKEVVSHLRWWCALLTAEPALLRPVVMKPEKKQCP